MNIINIIIVIITKIVNIIHSNTEKINKCLPVPSISSNIKIFIPAADIQLNLISTIVTTSREECRDRPTSQNKSYITANL
jgi:hypothetical protein